MTDKSPTDLAAALLRDVPRYTYLSDYGHLEQFMEEADVLAALSAHLDAVDERAGEVLERLRKADEYEPLGHDGWEAADLITALLAQNAALRAEWEKDQRFIKELCDQIEQLNAKVADWSVRAEAAEAEVEKLRGVERAARKLEENLGVKGVNVGSLRVDLYRALVALTTEADNDRQA